MASSSSASPLPPPFSFWRGAKALPRGARVLLSHRRLTLLALAPVGVAAVLGLLLLGVTLVFSDDLWRWLRPESPVPGARAWTVGVASRLLWGLILVLSYLLTWISLTSLLAAPLLEALSEAVEEVVTGRATSSSLRLSVLLVGAGRAVAMAGLRLLLWLGWMLPGLFLSFIPIVGPPAYAALALVWSGYWLAVGLWEPALDRRGLGVSARLGAPRQHPWLAAGFVTPLLAASLVPFLPLLLLPAAVAGGTLLVLDLEEAGALPLATR